MQVKQLLTSVLYLLLSVSYTDVNTNVKVGSSTIRRRLHCYYAHINTGCREYEHCLQNHYNLYTQHLLKHLSLHARRNYMQVQ
jgi:hypothetical protein